MSEGPAPGQSRMLRRKRALARCVLLFERAWPALWPMLGVLGLYAAFGLLDGPASLPPWPRTLLVLLVLGSAGALAWRGLRRVRVPGTADADRRLERDSGLRHRPLATLHDRPVLGGPATETLWQAHIARIAAQVGRLRLAPPRPGLAARDPRALRGGLLVLLAAALLVAGADAPARLGRAAWPGIPAGAPGVPAEVHAWATPPAYTGLPPILLRPDPPSASVPVGSHLTVSVTGVRGRPVLALGATSTPFKALDAASWQAEQDLRDGGHLAVRGKGRELAAWQVSLIPDLPPTAAFTAAPGLAPGPVATGSAGSIRLPWKAGDDYGVVSLQAELRLRDRPDAAPLVLPIPLAGSPRSAHGALTQDLTSHPWAGLPVVARLVAKDATGQAGRSDEAELTLPEREFHNPVAAAVAAVRKALSVQPAGRTDAAAALDALAGAPEAFDNSLSVFLNLEGTASLLRLGRTPEAVPQAQARLWQLALALEEGDAERTEKALAAAEKAVQDALQKPPQDKAAQAAELDKQMRALEDALRRHLQALADQAQRNGVKPPGPQTLAEQATKHELDRLMQQMRDAAREGRLDDAKQRLAQLEQMLQQMQAAKPGSDSQRQAAQARQEQAREQMGAVGDMVQREGALLDRTQQRVKPPSNPFVPDKPSSGQGQDQVADAHRQQALRLALGELMQQFGDLTGKVPKPLSDADVAMRGAAQALGGGQDALAQAAERRAIEALQRGSQSMSQQMAQMGIQVAPGSGQDGQDSDQPGQGGSPRDGQDATGNGQNGGPLGQHRRRDPLGRPVDEDATGSLEGGDVQVPDQAQAGRARAIQEELRRRDSERTRPQPELDYFQRLLKPF
jgi:uncharacterized protein (TIGR02302 family)